MVGRAEGEAVSVAEAVGVGVSVSTGEGVKTVASDKTFVFGLFKIKIDTSSAKTIIKSSLKIKFFTIVIEGTIHYR